MDEYVDFHAQVQMLLRSLRERNGENRSKDLVDNEKRIQRFRRRRIFDAHMFQVRPCICVSGFTGSAIHRVKSSISRLTDNPLPLESFHVTRLTDVKDGAFLVPKVILVAVHCPGRKLIDSLGNEGQLDCLYDEVIAMGADLLVIYLDLPKVIYPPAKDYIYHPRVVDLLFPSQPMVRYLSKYFGFVTVTEGSDFSPWQKNFLRDWVTKPVPVSHRVYRTSAYLSEYSETDWWSENEVRRGHRVMTSDDAAHSGNVRGFLSANEETSANKRKPKKQRRSYGTARADIELRRPLLSSSGPEGSTVLELELLNDESSYQKQYFKISEQL